MGGDGCGSVKLCRDAWSIITWTRSKNNEKITPPQRKNTTVGTTTAATPMTPVNNDRASVDGTVRVHSKVYTIKGLYSYIISLISNIFIYVYVYYSKSASVAKIFVLWHFQKLDSFLLNGTWHLCSCGKLSFGDAGRQWQHAIGILQDLDDVRQSWTVRRFGLNWFNITYFPQQRVDRSIILKMLFVEFAEQNWMKGLDHVFLQVFFNMLDFDSAVLQWF